MVICRGGLFVSAGALSSPSGIGLIRLGRSLRSRAGLGSRVWSSGPNRTRRLGQKLCSFRY